MSTVIVGEPKHYTDHGWATARATITIDGAPLVVYFRVSQGPLSTSIAPFVLPVVVPAMRLGATLTAHGALSEQVLALIRHFQADLPSIYDDLPRPPIEMRDGVPSHVEYGPDQRGVALFFSGGVDSFYTLLSHGDEITHVVFVHGFDTLLAKKAIRQQNVRALRQAAAELGKTLIEVEVNTRQVLDTYDRWDHHVATAAQLAISLLLAPQFKRFYIAENFDYYGKQMPGDPPRTYAADGVEIISDGMDCLRLDKTRYIAQSETALRWLRVCWQDVNLSYNCGRCEKCLRTMIALHIAGALPRCHTFRVPIDVERVRYLQLGQFAYFWPELLVGLEKRGDSPVLTEAVRDALRWTISPKRTFPRMLAGLERRGDHPELLEVVRQCMSWVGAPPEEQAQAERLRQAMERAHQLEHELAVIKNSRSWRLTAPLRAAGEKLRTLKARFRQKLG